MKVIFFANSEWYLYNFRLPLAKALRGAGAEVVMVSPHGPYGVELEAEGFRWRPVRMSRRSLNPLREARLLSQLARLYREERPELVHHFTIKCVVYGAVAARLAGVKASVSAVTGLGHVFCGDTLTARLLRAPVRGLLRYAINTPRNYLVLQNPDDLELFLKQRLVKPERVRVIRSSGVNTAKFVPSSVPLRLHPFRVLMATRLLWEKGVREYVEAASLLRERHPAVQFLLAGDLDPGNPTSVPRTQLNEWSKADRIHYIGHVSSIETLLTQVDLVVLPSYREGTPRILIEAAAAGLPIVTTDVPGCREVVRHGVNGFLVPPRDAPRLAEAIASVIDHPEQVQAMGCAGRRIALTEFDERIVIEHTLDVYRELVSGLHGTGLRDKSLVEQNI